MAKYKKLSIPHNVKERLRHRKIQNILEHVGKHVPKLSSDKKETKAKCLRRIVLYMKFLLQKQAEIRKSPNDQKDPNMSYVLLPKSKTKKMNEISSMTVPVSKIKSRKAQIVFLKKFSDISSPEQEIVSSTTMSKPEVIGNQESSTSCNFIQDEEEPCVTSEYPILRQPFGLFDQEVDSSSKEALFAVEKIKNDKDILPSIKAIKHSFNKKSSTLTCTDEDCKNNLGIHKRDARLSYPMINFLQEETDDAIEKIFMTDVTNANFIKDVATNSEISSVDVNQSMHASRPHRKELSKCSEEMREKLANEKSAKFHRQSATSEFSGKSTIFHDAIASAFVSVPKKNGMQFIASNSKNTFSTRIRNYSNIYAQSDKNFSGIPGIYKEMNPSLCSYSEDQDAFPADIFSSGESANITSSNEWISNDETDCASLTRSITFESPECYPEYLVNMSPKMNLDAHKDSLESFCDIENTIHPNNPSNLSFSSNNILSKSNADYHDEQVSSNSEEGYAFNRCSLNYCASEVLGHPKHLDNSQTVSRGSISNDLINFHTNAPEYYYLYHSYEDMPKESYPSRSVERIPKKELCVPDDMNMDFYETLEPSNYFNHPKQGGSSSCGTLGDVKIKQEFPDTLSDEEISYSFSNLNNLNWCSGN